MRRLDIGPWAILYEGSRFGWSINYRVALTWLASAWFMWSAHNVFACTEIAKAWLPLAAALWLWMWFRWIGFCWRWFMTTDSTAQMVVAQLCVGIPMSWSVTGSIESAEGALAASIMFGVFLSLFWHAGKV
jgi:hypothetical protein